MPLYASWVHGNTAQLERVGSPSARSKSTVLGAFNGDAGDIVDLGRFGSAACLRLGWGARFVIYDSGDEDREKSGRFWCHYGIPTPVIEADNRAEADTVLVNWESSDRTDLFVAAVHVWDGNKRIFADNSPPIGDFDGGIDGSTTDGGRSFNLRQLYRGDIPRRQIFFGIGVSLLIEANGARNDVLEVRGVGVDFQLRR